MWTVKCTHRQLSIHINGHLSMILRQDPKTLVVLHFKEAKCWTSDLKIIGIDRLFPTCRSNRITQSLLNCALDFLFEDSESIWFT